MLQYDYQGSSLELTVSVSVRWNSHNILDTSDAINGENKKQIMLQDPLIPTSYFLCPIALFPKMYDFIVKLNFAGKQLTLSVCKKFLYRHLIFE